MLYESDYYGVCDLGDSLSHHGIKGQKWGVRRYQYPDGSLTNAGRLRYSTGKNRSTVKRKIAERILSAYGKTLMSDLTRSGISKRYADSYIDTNTPLSRIQSHDKFENFAFYATYDKHDVNQYTGLFGKNLMARARATAKDDASKEAAKNMNVYRLELKSASRLKIPSENNAAHVTNKLLSDETFRRDLMESVSNAAKGMRRPSQQVLLKEAGRLLLNKDPQKMSNSEQRTVYRALNLSLVNHNEAEKRVQDKFYRELKKQGYDALLDINDKYYSSYHAKAPVIVFNTGRISVSNVTQVSMKEINKLYAKHNAERIRKDIPEQVLGNIAKASSIKISKISDDYVGKLNKYLSR